MKMRFYSDKDETHELMISCIVGFLYVEKNNPGYVKMEFLVNYCSFSRLITKHHNVLLKFTTTRLNTIYDNVLLQFTIAWLLQFSTTVIAIYDDSYFNLRQVLQLPTEQSVSKTLRFT